MRSSTSSRSIDALVRRLGVARRLGRRADDATSGCGPQGPGGVERRRGAPDHVLVHGPAVDPSLVARVPVVLASRVGVGPVLTVTYGYAGSESDLLARGLIGAGTLDPYKARVLLHLLLASGAERGQIAAAFGAMKPTPG